MKNIFKTAFLSGVIFVAGASVYALGTFNAWPYVRTLDTAGESSFAKVVIPFARGAMPLDLSVVRIVNQDSIEIPFSVSSNTTTHESVSTVMRDKGILAGATQFILDTGASSSIHTTLTLDTHTPNFKRQVKVFASSKNIPIESPLWALVTDAGYVFKFTDAVTSFTSGKSTIDFSPNTAQYFKVIVGSGDEGPVDVVRVDISGTTVVYAQPYTQDFPVLISENPKRHTTEVLADFGTAGYVVDAMTVRPLDKNFTRRVFIESSDDTIVWSSVGEGSISSISTPLFSGTSTQISFSAQKKRFVRMSILNEDNRPVALETTATFEGPVSSLVFEQRPSERYSLYYGNPHAYAPHYDIAHSLSYVEQDKLPKAVLGVESANPLYIPPQPTVVPYTESHPWVRNVVLIALVVFLGLGLVWYLKKYMKR